MAIFMHLHNQCNNICSAFFFETKCAGTHVS